MIRNTLLTVGVIAAVISGCYVWTTTDWYAFGSATLPVTRPEAGSEKASLRELTFDSLSLLQDSAEITPAVRTQVTSTVDLVDPDTWNWGDADQYFRLMQTNPAGALRYAQELEKLPIAKLRIEFLCRSSLGTGVTVAKRFQATLKKNGTKSVVCSRPFETPTRPGDYYVVVTLEEYFPGNTASAAQLHTLFCGSVHIHASGTSGAE